MVIKSNEEIDLQKTFEEKVPLIVIANKTFIYLAEKLKRFKESRVYIVFFIISLLLTFLFSTILFSIANYSLYKIDSSYFYVNGFDGYFVFLFYSFNALIMNSINAVIPVSSFSMILNMIMNVYGILLFIVLIAIVITINSQRYKEDLDKVINVFEVQSEQAEETLKSQFKMTVSQAVQELELLKHALVKFIKYIDNEGQQK